jgi:molybdopterin adenylyltransferase
MISGAQYSVVILTISDTGAGGEGEDQRGRVIREMVSSVGEVVRYQVNPDEEDLIVRTLVEWVDKEAIDLILTTGGTGLTARDVTPEATARVLEREIPGMAEAMRAASLRLTPHAMISRAITGIRGRSLIINLPGSRKAALENLEVLMPAIPHAIDKIQGSTADCAALPQKK